MATFLAIILAPGLGFGLVCFIFAHLLAKSNDIGDSIGDAAFYTDGVNFDTRMDRISKAEKENFAFTYSRLLERKYIEPDDAAPVHVFTEKDKLSPSKAKSNEQYNIDGELPPIDKPIFKPL